MTPRTGAAVIPIVERRDPVATTAAAPWPASAEPAIGMLHDRHGRRLHDLRISVTDRCNFRCTYCMPKDVFDRDHSYIPHADLLSFEEVTRLARAFVAHGVEKIRLTGGEPLLRRNVETLIGQLATLRTPAGGAIDLTLTTNGSLLRRKATALKAAGLQRLTVSLDALDDVRFRAMNDVDFPVAAVLDGIDAAAAAGFASVKINMVVKRGVNDDQVEVMARHFRGTGHVLRFIEFMDVGVSNHWHDDQVVPSASLVPRIDALFPIEPIVANYAGEVAERWRYRDGAGEIGFISSITQSFCGDCTRARLSPEGRLYTCLFASAGTDLRSLLRSTGDDRAIESAVRAVWNGRDDRYSDARSSGAVVGPKIEMSYIGG